MKQIPGSWKSTDTKRLDRGGEKTYGGKGADTQADRLERRHEH